MPRKTWNMYNFGSSGAAASLAPCSQPINHCWNPAACNLSSPPGSDLYRYSLRFSKCKWIAGKKGVLWRFSFLLRSFVYGACIYFSFLIGPYQFVCLHVRFAFSPSPTLSHSLPPLCLSVCLSLSSLPLSIAPCSGLYSTRHLRRHLTPHWEKCVFV